MSGPLKAFLLALALLIATSATAGEIKAVTSVVTGWVVYYGLGPLARPYEFGSDGNDMYVRFPADTSFASSGLEWVPWTLDSAGLAPSQSRSRIPGLIARSPGDMLLVNARRVADAESLHGTARAHRLVEIYRQSGLVDSAAIVNSADGPVIGVYFKGAHDAHGHAIPVQTIVDEPSAGPRISAADKVLLQIAGVVSILRRDGMVIVDIGGGCLVPRNRVGAVKRDLDSVRAGGRPRTLKDPAIIRRLQQRPIPFRELFRRDEP